MYSSVSPKDEIWFLRVYHHILNWPVPTFRLNHAPSIFCPQYGSRMLLPTIFHCVTLLKTEMYDYSPGLSLAASWKWEKCSACGSGTGWFKTVRLRCDWTVYIRVVYRFVEPKDTVRYFISEKGMNKSFGQFVSSFVSCCYIEVTMLNVVEGILETRKYCVSIVRYSTFRKDLYCLNIWVWKMTWIVYKDPFHTSQ